MNENSFTPVQTSIVIGYAPALETVITCNYIDQLTSLKGLWTLGGFGIYNKEFKEPYAPILPVG